MRNKVVKLAQRIKKTRQGRYRLNRYVVALDDKQAEHVEKLALQNDRSIPYELRALVRYALRNQYAIETLDDKAEP